MQETLLINHRSALEQRWAAPESPRTLEVAEAYNPVAMEPEQLVAVA
jgi:hypothetical protein